MDLDWKRFIPGWNVVEAGWEIVAGQNAADEAAKAAKKQKEANEARLAYDQEAREDTWKQLNADRQWIIEQNRRKTRNENAVAMYKDATNAASYVNRLQIRNKEQNSLNMQFAKSDLLFDEQVSFNDRAARTAEDSAWRQLEEINSEAAFDAQDQRMKALQAQGELIASGASGRSANKTHQAALASFGMQVAALNEGLASAGRNTKSVLEQIKDDQYSANLAAFAQKMLDPGELPMPIVPFKTPIAEILDPRPLDKEFDIGPEPILGYSIPPSAAAAQVWNATVPGIAGSVGEAWSNFITSN
tara:strand:+ start:432 stop:1337 length:906 start_codon:yes stop_codon:yes gene_type:complete